MKSFITNTETFTIGTDCEIISYRVKQQGYGRQSLIVDLRTNDGRRLESIHVQDVFPNILEHWNRDYILADHSSFDEETGFYHDHNGDGEFTNDQVCSDIYDLLNRALKGREIEIEIE